MAKSKNVSQSLEVTVKVEETVTVEKEKKIKLYLKTSDDGDINLIADDGKETYPLFSLSKENDDYYDNSACEYLSCLFLE